MFAPQLKLKKSVLAVAATLAPCLVLPASAFAQAADPAPAKLERVEITGSSIKRIDAETALPVTILKREDIERTGATSTEELVKQLSSLSSAGSSTTVANSSGYGGGSIATVSLRGLSSARTLVLVNGRRVAVYGGGAGGAAGSSVDINSIPLSAIERVEVLKDGASAIYGSDAIAGVVNFILRKDYTGAEVTGSYGQPTSGGYKGNTTRASVYAGFGKIVEDGFNISLGANIEKTNPIFGADRPYANRINVAAQNEVLSSIAAPANVFAYGSGKLTNPAFPNCGPVSQVSPYNPTRCSFDNSPFVSILPKSEKVNLMANGRLTINGETEGYFESSFNETKTTSTTQPVPLSSYGNPLAKTNPYNPVFAQLVATQYPSLNTQSFAKTFGTTYPGIFLLPPSSPYYPTDFANANGFAGKPLGLAYRDVANGARNTRDEADSARFVTGLRGTLAGWDYDTGFLYNQSRVKEVLLSGYAQYSKALPIFNSGVINPFGVTADPAALAAVQGAEFRGISFSSKTSTTGVDAKASRELFTLPAGAVSVAVGAEVRRESFAYDPSPAIQTGDIAGLGGTSFPVSASRNVASTYAEMSIPIVKKLDADVAVRFDHYQQVGNTVNPKASLRYQPTNYLLFRGSAGTGFRAPSLTDLYTPQATSVTGNGTRDPIRCPDQKTGAPTDCSFQFTTVSGGNPDLKPEKSKSFTLGVLIEPTRDISLGLDAFKVNLKDAIVPGGLSYTYFLSTAARATQYANFIQRGAPDGNASGVGPITSISQTNANLFKTNVSGVDVDAKYGLRLPDAQKVTLRLSGTYMNKYDQQGPDGTYSNILDQALSASGGGVVVRWKHTASATYEAGPWSGSFAQNYQKKYHDVPGNRAPAGTPAPIVDAYQTFDAQVSYSGFKSAKLVFGIKNLFDRDPPYTNNTSNFLGGYDVSYADIRGRFAYLTATYTFK
ncbi:MAG: TonB-dependent receptor [Herminiimonas sp.]|nr:TonB-dependent receptor [Herminiimonas sp.]